MDAQKAVVIAMGYMILEYFVCVLAVLAFATLALVISLVAMLAHEGYAYVLGSKRLTARLHNSFQAPAHRGSPIAGMSAD